MLPVATAIQLGAPFKVTASCCDLPQRQYFEDLFNENRGVFEEVCYCPNNKKSFSSAVDHVFRFVFVGVLITDFSEETSKA